MLETNANDLEFDSGRFVIVGTDRDISLTEVAKASFKSANVPVGDGLGLEGNAHYVARAYSYPSGCHVAEVEIDRDTGHVAVTRYAMVSDFGTIVNPMLLEGQMHGGVINGLGQALYEESVYDPDSGQLVTGSFMDYCIPRAREIPSFDWGVNPARPRACQPSSTPLSMRCQNSALPKSICRSHRKKYGGRLKAKHAYFTPTFFNVAAAASPRPCHLSMIPPTIPFGRNTMNSTSMTP